MEIQLQELIEQIKKDGVNEAEEKAALILEKAEAEAAKIISDAKAEAAKVRLEAKEENARLVKVSEDAIRQAGRNLLISFRDSVNRELDVIVGQQIKNVYSSEIFSDLIVKTVAKLSENTDSENMEILLNTEEMKKIQETLLSALKEKMLASVTLKPNDSFSGGFRIAVDSGRAYYDYSEKEVREMLSVYLNPRITALMKEAEEK